MTKANMSKKTVTHVYCCRTCPDIRFRATFPNRPGGDSDVRCPSCGKWHGLEVIKAILGVYRPEIACSDKCLSAKGHDCQCSCGGAHHGEAA